SPPVFAIEVDAVRVNSAVAQEAVVVVHVEIAAAPRKQFGYPAHLVHVLGYVRLRQHTGMLVQEASGKFELAVGGRRRKAGRYRIQEAFAAVPALDQRRALLVS